jgi:hypothetical protein
MAKNYKVLAACRMCKKRFEVKENKKFPFKSKYYCMDCCKKYFKDEEQ